MAHKGIPSKLRKTQKGNKNQKKVQHKDVWSCFYQVMKSGTAIYNCKSKTARDLEIQNNLFIFHVIKRRLPGQRKGQYGPS